MRLLFLFLFFVSTTFAAKATPDGVVKILIYPEELVYPLEDEALLTRGSGFLVTEDGIVFTNSDVVEWCVLGYMIVDRQDREGHLENEVIMTFKKEYENDPTIKKVYRTGRATPIVQVFNQKSSTLYKAEVIGMGTSYKGAALKIVSKLNFENARLPHFSPLPIGNSHNLVKNEPLTLLGFPDQSDDFGAELNQNVQAIQGKTVQERPHLHFNTFETTTPLNGGFSGGPALDFDQKVVGIIASPRQILPINLMCEVLKGEVKILNKLQEIGLCKPKTNIHINTLP